MKRIITLSIALVLSGVLLSLISSDSTAKAQHVRVFTTDTGLVTLGSGQKLRTTVTAAAEEEPITVTFRRIGYTRVCRGEGVCKHTVASDTASAPITLAPGEGASNDSGVDAADYVLWRTTIYSPNREPNVQVNSFIIDSATGAVATYKEEKYYTVTLSNSAADVAKGP